MSSIDVEMAILVLQLLLLAAIGGLAAALAARARPSPHLDEPLRSKLRDLAASSGASAAEDDAIELELGGRRVRLRLQRSPGGPIELAVELDRRTISSSAAFAEPGGYREHGARSRRRWRWITITLAKRPAWLLERLLGAHRLALPRGPVWVRSDAGRGELGRLFSAPDLVAPIAASFEAGAARLDMGDGGPTLAATLRDPRPDQLNPFTLGELAEALAALAEMLPPFEGAARARRDPSHTLIGLALLLVFEAPLFALLALLRYPLLLAAGAPLPPFVWAGAALGLAAALPFALALHRVGARWPTTRRRLRAAVAALTLALPAEGAGLAVTLNATLDRGYAHPYHGALDPAFRALDPWGIVRPLLTTHRDASGRPLRAVVAPALVGPAFTSRCPRAVAFVTRDGFFDAAWVEIFGCSSDSPAESPPLVAPPTAPEPGFSPPPRQEPPPPLSGPFSLRHLGAVHSKPPRETQLFDVHLQNQAAEARWFLLPDELSADGHGKTGLPDNSWSSSAADLGVAGRIPVVTLHGADHQALWLPAGGDVLIEGLQVGSSWDSAPAEVNVEVLIVTDLRWAGSPLEDRFGGDLRSSASALGRDCRRGLDPDRARSPAIPLLERDDGSSRPLTYRVVGHLRAAVKLRDERSR
ncbi:MAG: hypothetical protein U0359_29585 [Byssovorax sp.]